MSICLTHSLGGVIGIYADVFRSQVRSDEVNAATAATQAHTNVAVGLGEILVGFSFVKRAAYSALANHLPCDVDVHSLRIEGHATATDGSQDAAPVGVG